MHLYGGVLIKEVSLEGGVLFKEVSLEGGVLIKDVPLGVLIKVPLEYP